MGHYHPLSRWPLTLCGGEVGNGALWSPLLNVISVEAGLNQRNWRMKVRWRDECWMSSVRARSTHIHTQHTQSFILVSGTLTYWYMQRESQKADRINVIELDGGGGCLSLIVCQQNIYQQHVQVMFQNFIPKLFVFRYSFFLWCISGFFSSWTQYKFCTPLTFTVWGKKHSLKYLLPCFVWNLKRMSRWLQKCDFSIPLTIL